MQNIYHNSKNQDGLVSIMVASVLMVIMALITLGFTRAVQNEQRQAVDNQLSEQAYYAAESGINIAASQPGFPRELKDDCDVSEFNDGRVSEQESDEVTFTCVLINPTPSDLVFGNDSITSSKSRIVPIRTSPTASSITFEWNDNNDSNGPRSCAGNLDFEEVSDWDNTAPLRLDLIGIPEGVLSRDTLINNQFSTIFYPCVNTSSVGRTSVPFSEAIGAANVGKIIPVRCTGANGYDCSIRITGLTASGTSDLFSLVYARFNSVYRELNVRITAEDSSNNTSSFAGGQAVVDSTGRAVDIYRRLQARIPLYDLHITPTATLQTVEDICKLYRVYDDRVVVDAACR